MLSQAMLSFPFWDVEGTVNNETFVFIGFYEALNVCKYRECYLEVNITLLKTLCWVDQCFLFVSLYTA